MRKVQVKSPSFPEAPADTPLPSKGGALWQVLCGDRGHWRAGVYSPAFTSAEQCRELEKHDCPELFLLTEGRLCLVLADGAGGTRVLQLERGSPVLVTAPHSGFCPDGPHSGKALVIERDELSTEYRAPEEWR